MKNMSYIYTFISIYTCIHTNIHAYMYKHSFRMFTKIHSKNIHMCTHTPGLKAPPHIHSNGRTYMGNGVDLHKVFLAFKLDLAKQTPDRILDLL